MIDVGGSTLLIQQYKNSPQLLVSSVLTEYEWLPWKFVMCPRNYWDNINNHKKFVEWAGKQLKINELSDWNKITYKVGKLPWQQR